MSHRASWRGFGVVAFAVALLHSGCAHAPPRTGTITGHITYEHGGIQRGWVIIKANGLRAYADSTGRFTIANVPIGMYTLTAGGASYSQGNRDSVYVIEDQTTTVGFNLNLIPMKMTVGPVIQR